MAHDIERNFAAEAVGILTGQSSLLPEKEHLLAIAGQMESVLAEKKLLEEFLAAVMVDTGQKDLYFPAEDLDRVRKHHLALTVVVNPRGVQGSVLVTIRRLQPQIADAPPAGVVM